MWQSRCHPYVCRPHIRSLKSENEGFQSKIKKWEAEAEGKRKLRFHWVVSFLRL